VPRSGGSQKKRGVTSCHDGRLAKGTKEKGTDARPTKARMEKAFLVDAEEPTI